MDQDKKLLPDATEQLDFQEIEVDKQLSKQRKIQNSSTLISSNTIIELELDMSVNKCYVFCIMMTVNSTGMLIGYAMGYFNQTSDLINYKLKYNTEQANIMDAYIGSSVMLGMTIGAVSGGILMKIGRRKALFLSCIFGVIGFSITLRLNIYFLIIGRCLIGFSCGLFSSISPRYFEETIPTHLYNSLAVLYYSTMAGGGVISYFSGELLPQNKNKEALGADTNWKIIFAYFPLSLYLCVLVLLFTIVRHDSIKFLIGQNKTAEAKLAIKRMYKNAKTPQIQEEYYNNLKKNQGESSSKLTFRDALCNPQYRKATWVNIGYIIFHELTGINVIGLYSTIIFQDMDKKGGKLSPRQGTYIVGVVGLVSAWVGIVTIKIFGRRALCVAGHLLMAVLHGLIGYFAQVGNNNGVLLSLLGFIFIYQTTSGPVAWLYAIETTIDAALGICIFTLWGTTTILVFICPILMSKEYLGPTNVFYIFSGLSILGAIYSFFILKETKNMSDKEKKLIFTPKQYQWVETPRKQKSEECDTESTERYSVKFTSDNMI